MGCTGLCSHCKVFVQQTVVRATLCSARSEETHALQLELPRQACQQVQDVPHVLMQVDKQHRAPLYAYRLIAFPGHGSGALLAPVQSMSRRSSPRTKQRCKGRHHWKRLCPPDGSGTSWLACCW